MYKVGIITSSDKGSQGLREDKGGPTIEAIKNFQIILK